MSVLVAPYTHQNSFNYQYIKSNHYGVCIAIFRASFVAQTVKILPTMQDTQVESLGQKNPLKNGMTIHSRILAYRIPWTEEPGGVTESDIVEQVILI